MAKLVQAIIKDVVGAYANHGPDRAIDVWHRDEEVDEMYTALFRELLNYMMEDPRNITPCTHLLFVANNIERIGDHANNIAATTHYPSTGPPIIRGRPKKHLSGFNAVFTNVVAHHNGWVDRQPLR